jgi:hypothetical protein
MIYRELKYFVHLRHEFLLSKSHTKLPQSRTVLVTAIPDELSTEHDLRTFASFVPGGVDKVWMYRDSRELNELFEQRQEACQKLETAASAILVQATAAWRKKVKLHNKSHRKRKDEENAEAFELVKPEPTLDLLNELVPLAQRPRHRTGALGLVGSKVETIEWCKVRAISSTPCSIVDTLPRTKLLGSTKLSKRSVKSKLKANSWAAPLFVATCKWVHTSSRNASATMK